MKLKRCILHIGAPKSGSSSIQSGLLNGKKTLKEGGVLYPGHRLNQQFLYSLFHPNPKTTAYNIALGHQTENVIAEFHKQAVQQLDAEIEQSDAHTILFSHEDLSTLPYRSVLSLAEFLKARADTVEVYCYVRHPLSAAVSWSQQMIKTGRWRLKGLAQHKLFYDAEEYLPGFVQAFGRENLHVSAFEKAQLRQGDVCLDFINKIGLRQETIEELRFSRINESLSIEGAILSDALTELYPRETEGSWNQERPIGLELTEISGERFGLPRQLLKKVEADSKKSLDYIAKEFNVSLTAPSLDSLQNLPPRWGKATSEAIARKINNLTLQNNRQKSEICYLRGLLLVEKGNPETALEHLSRALVFSHSNFPALELVIKLLQSKNAIQKTKLLVEQYAALNQNDERFGALKKRVSQG